MNRHLSSGWPHIQDLPGHQHGSKPSTDASPAILYAIPSCRQAAQPQKKNTTETTDIQYVSRNASLSGVVCEPLREKCPVAHITPCRPALEAPSGHLYGLPVGPSAAKARRTAILHGKLDGCTRCLSPDLRDETENLGLNSTLAVAPSSSSSISVKSAQLLLILRDATIHEVGLAKGSGKAKSSSRSAQQACEAPKATPTGVEQTVEAGDSEGLVLTEDGGRLKSGGLAQTARLAEQPRFSVSLSESGVHSASSSRTQLGSERDAKGKGLTRPSTTSSPTMASASSAAGLSLLPICMS